jgi:hypothetical protein
MLSTPSPPRPDGYPDPACQACPDESGDDTWDIPALPGQQAALDALQWHWGTAYHIGVDDGEWWYRRRDGKGATETATTPDDLRTMIITDYTAWPVPREYHTTPDEASSQPAPPEPTTP